MLTQLWEQAKLTERGGKWKLAREQFAELFRQACGSGDVEMAVSAARGEAQACRRLERFEEAEELADLSREIAEACELPQHAARALNVQALNRFTSREWGASRALFLAALERARDVGDDELIGYVCLNLGVIANILGDLREARLHYLESIGAAIRARNEITQAMVYNNLGMVCADLGEWMESQLYFERGIEIAERLNDLDQLAKLYANRAEPLIHMGELEQATASLDRAEGLARRVSGRLTLIDVARFRGRIARISGDYAAAERYLVQALRLAERGELQLERAEVMEELGHLHLSRAGSMLHRAREVFEALGATRDTSRVDALLQAWPAGEQPEPRRPSAPAAERLPQLA